MPETGNDFLVLDAHCDGLILREDRDDPMDLAKVNPIYRVDLPRLLHPRLLLRPLPRSRGLTDEMMKALARRGVSRETLWKIASENFLRLL